MLSLKYIRNNLDLVKKSIQSKNIDFDLKKLLDNDKFRREIIQKVESLKSQRNIINKKVSSSEDRDKNITMMREISKDIKKLDSELNTLISEINNDLLYIPNIIHESVPIGKDEKSNEVIREWGEKPKFDFRIKGHLELCEMHKLIDFKSASKISGSAFPLYTQVGAKYERSLINFMLETHINDHGYNEVSTPFIVSSSAPQTTGNLPKFKEDMYYIEADDMYCIPTAEVPVTNIHSDSVLDENELPKKYVAYSPCFRREAGSYGKDTKGLLRVHQFNKVELVQFVHPEISYDTLETLLINAERILQRRGNIKYRSKKTNKLDFLHTLNGSGLATPRLLVALLETYQNEDGSICIPDILSSYLNINKIK